MLSKSVERTVCIISQKKVAITKENKSTNYIMEGIEKYFVSILSHDLIDQREVVKTRLEKCITC